MAKPVDSLSLERRVDALFAKYTLPGSPGAVVAVTRAGHLELCKGYGLASIEHGVPITPRTRFRIASVSKQFTVTADADSDGSGNATLTISPPIITSGPYRFTKHPAYLCKNLSWWLISMPFMLSSTWQDSLRHCAMLLLANAVYYWRAKTEEKHLLSDHNYQAYAQSFHTKTATL